MIDRLNILVIKLISLIKECKRSREFIYRIINNCNIFTITE